jgi:hypothetical protein
MKHYEIYSRNFSQVIQRENLIAAIAAFEIHNPKEEIVLIENVEARNEVYTKMGTMDDRHWMDFIEQKDIETDKQY